VIRFVHTSDLHLGKRFGRFPEDLRGRLREARHASIGRLAAVARANAAGWVLVAGDTFDAETPAPATLRQALHAMAETGVRWLLLPGNHDSLAARELWARVAADRPPNVTLALAPEPVALGPGAVVLPAPCTYRRPGRDLTDWMPGAATPAGALRIGLAHGAVQEFSEDGNAALIPPDRAERAGLAWLALGDWHGQIRIGPCAGYAGSPEADGFKHAGPAGALLVTLPGPGAPPEVAPVATGSLRWRTERLDLLPGEDPAARLERVLPPAAERRDTLLRLEIAGRTTLAGEAALEHAVRAVEHDFAWLERDAGGLATERTGADLDAIDRPGGALRAAAEALRAEAGDPDLPAEEREAAAAALSRLYAFAGEVA
jgi:hypothetical protein